MDLTQLSGAFTAFKKNVLSADKILKEISRLDQNRIQNLSQLKVRAAKLEGILQRLSLDADPREALSNWASRYKQALMDSEEQLRVQFGAELEQELKKIGLPLSGQYPALKAGLFTIEPDFDKGQATLWYGPKQERLDKCHLTASKVANRIEKAKRQLGSGLSEDEFLKKLQRAYSRVAESQYHEPIPIIKVLAELAHLLQSSRFYGDPRRENYKSYSRADFSYDLFRVQRSEPHILLSKKFQLVVATRVHTKQRQDFLWVPEDESGKGTTYSHLQFKEALV